MKRLNIICVFVCLVMLLTACANPLVPKPEVNIDNVPWEAKMGINYLDDRAAMIEFTNNTEFTVTELALEFKMKENIEEERLNDFYSHLKEQYKLSEENIKELQENGISMSSHAYLSEEEYIKKGEKVEETLLYGIKFIRTLDYYDLFEPELYRIEYIDEDGEPRVTYYDYLNKTYTEK